MIIYSEHKKPIGSTRKSPCGCSTQLVIQGEPWRTMLNGVMDDYFLVAPFEGESFRIDSTEDPHRWLVKAKSALEENLWVNVAEVVEDEEGLPIFSLMRIRPQYTNRRRSRREKKSIN